MMKKILKILVFFLIGQSAFAYSGLMAGQAGKLKIAKTRYFDIIYTPQSEATANLLFEKADGLFEELCQLYKVPNKFRTTVTIGHSQDMFNAYFTAFPYNSIVMYDTPPTDSLMVFSDSFLNTFRHELTHAISYNSKNKFWHGASRIFGDVINPALFTITMGWAEGAAVSTESNLGEGRQNSDLHKLLVKQAKIEGKFPKYSEIHGARDISPGGNLSYYFGGAFSEYLQKKYGFEKYAQFWYNAVNIQRPSYLFYFSNFKKVYGIKIAQAWEEFFDSIEIPDVNANPWEEDWCSLQKSSSMMNVGRSMYPALTASRIGYAYYDYYTSKIIFIDKKTEKAKTVAKSYNFLGMSISSDGKFIALSSYRPHNNFTKTYLSLVNTENKAVYNLKEPGLRDGTVFFSNGNYYVAAVKTISQNSSLKIYKINLNKKNKITDVTEISEFKAPFGKQIFSTSGTMDGKILFAYKDGLDFSICVYDFEQNLFRQFFANAPDTDEKSVFLQLNTAVNGKVSFTFTQKGTMPRLGIFNYNSDFSDTSFDFCTKDSSGGVFNSGLIDDGKKAVFVGHFFEEMKIMLADLSKMNFRSVSAIGKEFEQLSLKENLPNGDNDFPKIQENLISEKKSDENSEEKLPIESESKKYSSFKYTFTGPHGVFAPLGMTHSYGFRKNQNGTFSLTQLLNPIGVSYFSASPWTNPIWGLSASYNPFTESFSVSALAHFAGNKTVCRLEGNSEFDFSGFKQTYETLNFLYIQRIAGTTFFEIADNGVFFYGRQSFFDLGEKIKEQGILNIFGILKNPDMTKYLYASNVIMMGLGNINKLSPDTNSQIGWNAFVTFQNNFFESFAAKNDIISNSYNLGLFFSVKIPKLLPFEMYKMTLNLPTSLSAELFPSQNYFASLSAAMILFATEIQRSTNTLPLFFFNRFSVKTSYTGNFADTISTSLPNMAIQNTPIYAEKLFTGKAEYYDELAFTVSLEATPNFGGFARSNFKLSFDCSLLFRPYNLPNQNKFGSALMGVALL